MLFRNKSPIFGAFAAVFLFGSSTTGAESIFSDSFDSQPDWHSGLPENHYGSNTTGGASDSGWNVDIGQFSSIVPGSAGVHVIPQGWDLVRQTPAYAPSRGDAGKHEVIEISEDSIVENPNRALGGTGKSAVFWRDSNTKNFVSDGILGKYFPEGLDQVYVEFWFNWSNETIWSYHNDPLGLSSRLGQSKLFRIYSWTGESKPFDFYSDKNPHMIWGFEGGPKSLGGYGFRNKLSFLTRRTSNGTPSESRYIDDNGNPSDDPPSSYHPSTTTLYGGGIITNQLTGQPMSSSSSDYPDIDQIFGDETHWTKMGFFVKMNSAPGAFDGVFKQWLDDTLITDLDTVQWVSATRDMVKWNVVALGGNDHFFKYPNSEKHEEWYAIDEVKIANEIPDYLIDDAASGSDNTAPPIPPSNIHIK